MWLEDSCDLLVLIEFAHGQHALFDFRGMMCIVAQEDYPVVLYLEVEPAVYSAEAGHAFFDFFIGHSVQVCQCHGSYSVLNVDTYRDS